MNTKEKQNLLAAIKSGEYTVEIEESNLITEYTKYDGTPFLRISQHKPHQGYHFGYCHVLFKDFALVCHLEDGTWYREEEVFEDTEIIAALSHAEGIVSGAHSDGFSMCELYARLNHLPEDIDFCMEDEGYCLKDINEIGGRDAEIVISYTIDDGNEEYVDLYCDIDDGNLFDLYKFLKKKEALPKGKGVYELTDKSLKYSFPDLYDEIMELIEEEEDNEETTYKFHIPLSQQTFELVLYGDIENN